MICPGCGRESIADSVFCTYCGVKLRPDVNVESSILDSERKALRDAISRRRETDRIIPAWIVVIPFILIMVVAILMVAVIIDRMSEYDLAAGEVPTQEELMADLDWMILLSMASSAVYYIVYAVLAYLMVDRSNKHLDRERAVSEAVSGLLRKVAGVSGQTDQRSPWDTPSSVPDSAVEGTRASPMFWAMAIILPLFGLLAQNYAAIANDFDLYAGLQGVYIACLIVHAILMFYMLHFMTDGIWRHDTAWTNFAVGTKISLARAGGTAGGLQEGSPLRMRSSALYILASFLTFGIFLVYWWYVAVEDANVHYAKQARFEDQLIDLLSGKT